MTIVMRDVMKVYKRGKSEVIALRGVDAMVNNGEFVTIVGPSGCGKTTLLNIIGGLDIPTAGSIVVDGGNICSYTEKEFVMYRRNYVGIVFQFFNLVPTLSAKENIELPMLLSRMSSQIRKDRVMKLLNDTGMTERADHMPDELSGGEQQRIAIAVALANNPSLILADEPTGELDSKSGNDVLQLFKKLQIEEKKTLIIATHDARIAEISDRVLNMKDGKITNIDLKNKNLIQNSNTIINPALVSAVKENP